MKFSGFFVILGLILVFVGFQIPHILEIESATWSVIQLWATFFSVLLVFAIWFNLWQQHVWGQDVVRHNWISSYFHDKTRTQLYVLNWNKWKLSVLSLFIMLILFLITLEKPIDVIPNVVGIQLVLLGVLRGTKCINKQLLIKAFVPCCKTDVLTATDFLAACEADYVPKALTNVGLNMQDLNAVYCYLKCHLEPLGSTD